MTPGQGPLHPFPRGQRGRILAAVALLLATLLAGTALLALAGGFITACALAAGTASGFNFFSPSAGIRALTFARIASRYFEKLVGHDATLRIARDLRTWFFRRALPLAPARLGRLRTGALMARLMDDIARVDGRLVRASGPLLAMAGLGLLGVAWAGWILPEAGAVLAGAALAIGSGSAWPLLRRGQVRELRDAGLQARLRIRVHEGIEGAADLAAMDAQPLWAGRIEAASMRLAEAGIRRQRRLSAAGLVHALCGTATLLTVVALAMQAAHAERITATEAAALCFATLALLEAWAGAGLAWQALVSAQASARRLAAVTGQVPPVADPLHPLPVPTAGPLRVEQVRFAHRGGRVLLDGVSLQVRPGERVVVSGDSGSGKSTLLALVLRVHDPDEGRIGWAGTDLRRFDQSAWHARLAWLPQEAPVFAGSVRANLAMGDPQADDAAMWRMLQALRLEARIRQGGGLDARVGEGGALLSTGQARRLALARALLRPASLLLLDEPTEGLEVDAAEAFLCDLEHALGPRSLLLVSHAPVPATLPWRRLRLERGRLCAG